MIEEDRVLGEDGPSITRTISQWKVELLSRVERALTVKALTLMIVNEAQQNHLIDLVDVLVDN